jgi:hypothetical protein
MPTFCLTFALVCCLGLRSALGVAWYVDNSVGTSGTGTSWATAWKNFSNIVWASLSPGDTLYLSGGSTSQTYTETLTVGKGGSAGNPITITKGLEAGHNGTVTIDGQLTRFYGVLLDSFDYVTISNLDVRNHAHGDKGQIHVVRCNGVVVDQNILFVTDHGGVYVRLCSNTTVSRNMITTTTNAGAIDPVTTQCDGIYSQENLGGNVYENNTIVISDEDTVSHDDCLQSFLDTDITFRGNWCEHTDSKTVNSQGIWITDFNGTALVYNNVVKMPNAQTTHLALWNQDSGTGHLEAYNNTLIGNGSFAMVWLHTAPASILKNNLAWSTDVSTYAIMRVTGTMPATANIQNNLWYAPTGATPFWAETANIHYTFAGWQGLGYDTAGLHTNPLLNANYTLQSGSPARNIGSVLTGIFTTDKNQVTRGGDVGPGGLRICQRGDGACRLTAHSLTECGPRPGGGAHRFHTYRSSLAAS